MARNFQMLQEDWPATVKPLTGTDRLRHRLGSPLVPASSAASTLILLDEDRRAGRVSDGDLVAFLWIGAGNGAMNGYATMVL